MFTPATIRQSSRLFEAGALVPKSARSPTRRRAVSALADRIAGDPIEFLVERFPVIRRLVGDQSFCAVARRFIAGRPAGLRRHDEAFPGFLRSLGKTVSIEYVVDLAVLEMVQGKASQAADARPVDDFASLQAEKHSGTRVVLSSIGIPGRITLSDRDNLEQQ